MARHIGPGAVPPNRLDRPRWSMLASPDRKHEDDDEAWGAALFATLSLMRQVLRANDVPQRSWLLFHDSELANEWLGVYPETPPPPA